jgi:hypothetical protein
MKRHRGTTNGEADRADSGIGRLLQVARVQVEAIDREVGLGRVSGKGILDELAA